MYMDTLQQAPSPVCIECQATVNHNLAHVQENLDTRWHSRLELLIGFVNTHGKLPRTTEVHQGKRLGSWFSTQQSLYAQGKLDSHKQQQLDAVPGWKWQKHPQVNRPCCHLMRFGEALFVLSILPFSTGLC